MYSNTKVLPGFERVGLGESARAETYPSVGYSLDEEYLECTLYVRDSHPEAAVWEERVRMHICSQVYARITVPLVFTYHLILISLLPNSFDSASCLISTDVMIVYA